MFLIFKQEREAEGKGKKEDMEEGEENNSAWLKREREVKEDRCAK